MANIKLTEKQRKYCDYVMSGLTKVESAAKAGYSSNISTGDIESKQAVKDYLNKIKSKLQEASVLKVTDIVNKIQSIVDDPDTANKDKLKGLEMLGKYLKMFTDRVEHSGDLSLDVKVDFK